MKRLSSFLVAASSLWLAAFAFAEARPHYGGTLHVAVHENCPALPNPDCAHISRLIFETLVQLDAHGRPQPMLAASWQAEPGNQRWRFQLRGGISLQDGSPLDSATVAASLRSANPDWKVLTVGESILIETSAPSPSLPAELALVKNSIARSSGGQWFGTGPFSIQQLDPGKKARLLANEQYWRGRPFLDAIEVDFGKSSREQLLSFEIGKSDLAGVSAEDIRRANVEGRTVLRSEPADLLALVFTDDARSEDDAHLRSALALAIDSAAISDVVFQGGAEAGGSLLPNWLSGYAFIFPTARDLQHARQERMQIKHSANLNLSYDPADPVARVTAERILLNARDAGLTVQLSTEQNADVRLVRVPVSSLDPTVALKELVNSLHWAVPVSSGSTAQELYTSEKTLLQSRRVIPLLHLRSAVVLRNNIRDVAIRPDGSWDITGAWISMEKP